MANDEIAEALSKEKTFKEVQGLPAVEHKKGLEKRKAQAAQEAKKNAEKNQFVFYTVKDNKYLRVTVKKNGAYTSYVTKGKKMTAEEKTNMIKNWESVGQWVPEHLCEEVCSKKIAELNKK